MYLARSGSPGAGTPPRVVPRLGSHVDRHSRDPIRDTQADGAHRRAAAAADSRVLRQRIRWSESSSRTSPAAGSAASAGSRSTDASSRSVTPARTSFRPGTATRRVRRPPGPGADADRGATCGDRALGSRRRSYPWPASDRPGQPVYAISEAPSREGAGYGRPALRSRAPRALMRARPRGRARDRSAPARRRRLSLADAYPDRGRPLVALGGQRRHPLQSGGVGLDALRAMQLQQV